MTNLPKTAPKKILCIGGLHPHGVAGLDADRAAVESLGHQCITLPSCHTLQPPFFSGDIQTAHTPAERDWFAHTLVAYLPLADAIKIGLLVEPTLMEVLATELHAIPSTPPVVADPVYGPTTGGEFHNELTCKAWRSTIANVATVVTPNRHELDAFFGGDTASSTAMIVTGGDDDPMVARDTLFEEDETPYTLESQCIAHPNPRGTGCLFSSALSCALAEGESLRGAFDHSKRWLHDVLRQSAELDQAPATWLRSRSIR